MDLFEVDQHPDIQCIWTLEERADYYNAGTILPDSTIELVINCGAPLHLKQQHGLVIELPQIFVKGLQDKPLEIQVVGDMAQIIGVRLNAWSLPCLRDAKVLGTQNIIVPLDGIWRVLARTLSYTVAHHGYPEAVFVLHEFLDGNFQNPSHMQMLRQVGQILYATGGKVSISKLSDECHYSLSQLERLFKDATGITLKRMARLIRFEMARDRLQANPSCRLADLAHDLGYTDQSHFTRDFKAFAGFTPGA